MKRHHSRKSRFRPHIEDDRMLPKGVVAILLCAFLIGCTARLASAPSPQSNGMSAGHWIVQNGPPPHNWVFLPELPNPASLPMDIAYRHDGAVWFAEENGQRIGRYAMDGSLTEYPTPGIYPAYVRPGPDNDMWFNDGSHMIGRVTSSGAVQIYSLGLHYVVESMNTGPDKRMWFDADLCFQTCKYYIAEFLSSTGSYRILNTSCAPQFIGLGADGNLWAMGPDSSHMETVSASGCQEQVQLPGNQFCCDYGTQIVNAHGNIWLSVIDNPPVPTALDYFDTRSRSFTVYPITIQNTR